MSDPVVHTVIKRVCCVCGKVLGYTEGYGQTGVSHGYCATHLEEAKKEAGFKECTDE